jgi:hypothetical protein
LNTLSYSKITKNAKNPLVPCKKIEKISPKDGRQMVDVD